MAIKTLQSNQVTFVDTTDSRKLEVYLASNLPTVQIYNVNTGAYSPDWSVGDKLKLTASIYLDSRGISPTTIRWYKQIGTGAKTQLTITGTSLIISTNEMSGDSAAIITYFCEAEYQGLKASAQITFTRTDTGLNGSDGNSAYNVIAQYSVDNASSWTETLNSETHKYIRFSYDGGANWTAGIKIAGEDGTSVTIIGTAYCADTLEDSDIGTEIDLYSDPDITTLVDTSSLNTGDGYIVQGYLCVYNQTDGRFICSGTIQGPKGSDGQSSYLFVRYAEDNQGTGITESPNSATKWISTYVSHTNNLPTLDKFIWRKFVGEDGKDAKAIVLNGSSQIFKVNNGTVAPTTITVTAQAINTSVVAWTYSTDGGKTFTSTRPSGVTIGGNVVTVTGSTLSSDSLVIKATDNTYSDTYTVYKVSDGAQGATGTPASMAFLTNENISFGANANGQIKSTTFTTNVVAYTGTTKVTPVVGTPTGLPTGMTLSSSTTTSNEVVLSFSIADNATLGATTSTNGTITIPITSPVSTNLKLNWSKINAGADGSDGVGISSVTVDYGVSNSSSTQPTTWQATLPTVADGQYLWTRTITDYTDTSIADTITLTYAKQGTKGDTGSAGSSVTVSSIQYQEGLSATTAPTGTWSSSVVLVAEGRYLWTKTTFSDGKIAYGVAKQGSQGKGISKITEYYLATTAPSGVTTSTSGWTTTVQTISSSKKYLWNYEVVTYTDNTTSSTTPVIIGVYGSTGDTGKGIKSVTEYYLASASSSEITTTTSGWTTTMQILTATNKYLWNYELITYTDNTTSTIAPVIIGVYGDIGPTGAPGNDAVTFQVYSSTGYALSTNTPVITLQTFAYIGDVAITSGATYQWYSYNDGWTAISGATLSYIDISRDSVSFSRSYMCKMIFGGVEYTGVATIDDKNDTNTIFSSKPSAYTVGDLWIVGTDYIPSGVEIGTLLRTEHTNSTYTDSDWVVATKYDEKIDELKGNIDEYNQYFSFDQQSGLRISARDANGNASQFSTTLSNERLSFNQGTEAVAYIESNKMKIKEAEIVSPLTVTGQYSGSTMLQAPVINIGNFSIIVESNGSLSIVANT